MDRYTIGLDYGSLSARGVLVNTATGAIVAEAEYPYPHAVMDTALPDGTPLGHDWALQHPQDYMDALTVVVPALLERSGIDPQQVIALGVDFTASSVIPLDRQLRPLCLHPEFQSDPYAYCMMWKHHAAQPYVQKLTEAVRRYDPQLLEYAGGKLGCESLVAKITQVCLEAPQVYEAAGCFAEAGDYITSLLAGRPVCGLSCAAAKALWTREKGWPDGGLLGWVDPRLEDFYREKYIAKYPDCACGYPGERVGTLCPEMARKLGLHTGVVLSAFQLDGYSSMPAVGAVRPGRAMGVVGTSLAVMLLDYYRREVPGITASLPGCHIPGFHGYGSGQASLGDMFGWFVRSCVPQSYWQAAGERNMHSYLMELASRLRPGESGLLVLEWWGGCKCLPDKKLSGTILGLTMQTRPEEVYRALLEAAAFAARNLLERHMSAGVPVEDVVVCGGIAGKNPLLMQIYADVLGREIRVSHCAQAPALGTAIFAACAAGEDLNAASQRMGSREFTVYQPREENRAVYDRLYAGYQQLYHYFGEQTELMGELAALQ